MGWRVWGNVFESGELSNQNKYVRLKPNKNIILDTVRTWVIFYNNPTLTSLTMKIFSDDGGTPRKLLHESTTTLLKGDIITENNGVKEIYFEFENIPLQEGTHYHFIISGSGYVPTTNSFLAWMHAFPDPVYEITGYTASMPTVNRSSYALYLIGADY